MNSNVAITGHTSGIGKCLFDTFTNLNGAKTLGFSRANGYDLADGATIKRIVEESADAKIFINNAYNDWVQIDLLYALFDVWKSKADRYIINIGSNSGDVTKTFSHKYAAVKIALDKACLQLNNVEGRRCKVINIRPGWVSTPRTQHINPKPPMLEVHDVCRTVLWVLSQPQSVTVSTLTIEPTITRL